ncbi:SRPBCC family protein [Verrucosispora sp. NA02020]|uniref:SRPBCC family protein n=1 Tax=Verrucosispora sp. NA02020 TaxID=2742132 RepID=UPI003D71CC36
MPGDRTASIAFETVGVVAASSDEVYRHLTDPHSYVGLSPLIVAVTDVRTGQDADGRPVTDYVAVERFRMVGPLRWDNPIRVRMVATRPGRQIISDVRSPGWVRLRAVVDLTPEAGGTRIRESVTADAPLPLRRFVAGQARRVAAYRAAELARRMASRP